MSAISGKAVLAGVFGWPVGHSQSPRLHGYWLDRYKIDGAYLPLATNPENFEEALRALPKLGFAGANVTVPHKEQALKLVDHLDQGAEVIGAVNTLVVQPDGSLAGTNTDAFGFIENLKTQAPMWQANQGPAMVLGAGGAARAVIFALIQAGTSEIRLTNRTAERAEQLAAEFSTLAGKISVVAWDERDQALASVGTLVNTTTLGMSGKGELTLPLDDLPAAALVTDIVYTPLLTPLLKSAESRGNTVVDGLGMLLHQARPGFEAWFGVAPDVTPELRDYVLAGMGT